MYEKLLLNTNSTAVWLDLIYRIKIRDESGRKWYTTIGLSFFIAETQAFGLPCPNTFHGA